MPTPPPEVTQTELEELYNSICTARENFLEAKEKCFRLFCLVRRRECYLQRKNKMQGILNKKTSKPSKRPN